MSIPPVIVDLHEPDATFDQPSRDKTLPTDRLRRGIVQAVHFLGLFSFLGDVERFGGTGLHAVGQLKRFQSGIEIAFKGALLGMFGVAGF